MWWKPPAFYETSAPVCVPVCACCARNTCSPLSSTLPQGILFCDTAASVLATAIAPAAYERGVVRVWGRHTHARTVTASLRGGIERSRSCMTAQCSSTSVAHRRQAWCVTHVHNPASGLAHCRPAA